MVAATVAVAAVMVTSGRWGAPSGRGRPMVNAPREPGVPRRAIGQASRELSLTVLAQSAVSDGSLASASGVAP